MSDFKTYVENLSEEERSKIFAQMESVAKDFVDSEIKKLQNLKDQKDRLKSKERELYEIERQMTWGPEKNESMNQRRDLNDEIRKLTNPIRHQENLIEALKGGGTIRTITDMYGDEHPTIPDFRSVPTEDIAFSEEDILLKPKPSYIPFISEKHFESKGYIFDAIRIQKDTYLLATESFDMSEERKSNFVVTTLDQLVLTLDYYFTKAKAEAIKEAKEKTEYQENHYNGLPRERRESFLNQRNFYHSLPAKIKKEITQEKYESLSLEEKEKLYKPYKRYNPKRLKSKLGERSMWVSFHEMYQRFINDQAYPIDQQGNPVKDWKTKGRIFGNPEVFQYWYAFRDFMEFKIKDIQAQREDQAESYKAAFETSYGEANTETQLKEKLGILIKTQSGKKVSATEQSDIEKAWISVNKVFGDLKPNALKYNLKISHSGDKYMFASKAVGMFVPMTHAIGVSMKYGFDQFELTMAHETGHFIDYFVGQQSGKRWATDDYESIAGKIAFTFRNKMNKPKAQQTDYINSTKECFARAFEQYYGYKVHGKEAILKHSYSPLSRSTPVHNADHFVNYETFETEIVPLIEQFLSEQFEVFETTYDITDVDQPQPVGDLETTNQNVENFEQQAEESQESDQESDQEQKTERVSVEYLDLKIRGLKFLARNKTGEDLKKVELLIKGLEILKSRRVLKKGGPIIDRPEMKSMKESNLAKNRAKDELEEEGFMFGYLTQAWDGTNLNISEYTKSDQQFVNFDLYTKKIGKDRYRRVIRTKTGDYFWLTK